MMARIPLPLVTLLGLALSAPPSLGAQGVPKFKIARSPIQLEGPSRLGVYLGGVGREAAFFGYETGEFEAWGWPVKLFHDFELGFKIPDYSEPISARNVAKRVIVRPEAMTVIYSHAAFTVLNSAQVESRFFAAVRVHVRYFR